MNGKNKLKFTTRRDLINNFIIDDERGKWTLLALTEYKEPEENLLAVSQMMNIWISFMQIKDNPAQGIKAWIDRYYPPLLNSSAFFPNPYQLEKMTTLDGTPLEIR